MSTQPTAGAIKAASQIMLRCGPLYWQDDPVENERQFAKIIDRETGAKELADALAFVLSNETHRHGDGYEQARAALARYNGGSK